MEVPHLLDQHPIHEHSATAAVAWLCDALSAAISVSSLLSVALNREVNAVAPSWGRLA